MAATGDRVPTVYIENRRIVGLNPKDPIAVSYKAKMGTEPTSAENPELLKLKHTHGHDMTIVNGVGRIGWMTGGKSARWKDADISHTLLIGLSFPSLSGIPLGDGLEQERTPEKR